MELRLLRVFRNLALAGALCSGSVWGAETEFEAARPILSSGQPIDVERWGHAAPCVADFDGDGRGDLLVGEIFRGQLRVYRNVGTSREPEFRGYRLFQDGAHTGCIPAG
jgi:hypothetical protein